MQQPRPSTARDEAYLEFVRSKPCCACNRPGPSEAHHEPMGFTGMGMKPPDYQTVPLCRACHQERHDKGVKAFWRTVTPRQVCIELLSEYVSTVAVKTRADAISRLQIKTGDILVLKHPKSLTDQSHRMLEASLAQALAVLGARCPVIVLENGLKLGHVISVQGPSKGGAG